MSPIPRTLGIYVACIGLAWGMSGGSSAIGHFQHDEDVATESGQSVPVVASGTGSQQTGEGVDAVNGVLTDGKCI
ncbi:MAG TPA: hypothetical protein EYN18_07455, partial [Nitrospirales bacterium]|nr:hypothetical protein [Nitrospirales bacterium]